ncbi:MAG: hypothetical protein ACREFG_12585 [Chthoniobacterales bacterium]
MNLDSNELLTINRLSRSGGEDRRLEIKRCYNLSAPKRVSGRNSDNTLIRSIFGWELSTRLPDGLERTYRWIHDQMVSARRKGMELVRGTENA